MKRFMLFSLVLLTALIAFLTLFAIPETALADDSSSSVPSWVRIVDEDTWLFKNATDAASDKLFKLAYSYYLKVIDVTQNGFYRVELMENNGGFVKIFGYVKRDSVSAVTEQPAYPTYPSVIVTVKQTNAILFSQPSAVSQSVCAVYDGQILYYYGSYPAADSTWFFVRYDQNLCYVNASGVSAPAVSLHPTPVTIIVDTQPTEPDQSDATENPSDTDRQDSPAQSSSSLSKTQIVIIALVCIPALIIVVVLFLPAKSKKQKYYTPDSAAADTAPPQTNPSARQPRYFDDFL